MNLSADLVDQINPYLTLVDKMLIRIANDDIGGLNRLLNSRGKRLRPIMLLSVAACNDKGVNENTITLAAAVEMVHLASLVHDDIMDSGTIRWGVPTINSVEGPDMALLAGDYLLGKGLALAGSASSEAGTILSKAIFDLSIGQAREIHDRFNLRRSQKDLNAAILGKTCSMFKAALHMGGLMPGLNKTETKILDKFAEYFGLAFQYKDDLKDFEASSLKQDKQSESDFESGNYTLPIILSLNGSRGTELKEVLNKLPIKKTEILEIIREDNSVEETLSKIKIYQKQIDELLEAMTNLNLKTSLKAIAAYLK